MFVQCSAQRRKSRQPIIDTQYTVHNKTCHYVTAGNVNIYPLQQFTEAKCAIYKKYLKGWVSMEQEFLKGQ